MLASKLAFSSSIILLIVCVMLMITGDWEKEGILETDHVNFLGLHMVCNKKTDTCVCFKSDSNVTSGYVETKCP